MTELSVKEQYKRVGYLGLSFMLMFSSFNSLQNIVSKLYDEYHYYYLGQYTIISIYLMLGICTIFTSYIIKKLGYKKVMFLSSLGYAIFESTGFLIVIENNGVPRQLVFFLVIVGSMLCGASASFLWVAQAGYTSAVASEHRKSQLFGLFWGIMMSSQIVGNLITTFILGKISNLIYFVILAILGFASSIMFLFLPNLTQQQKEDNNIKSLKEQMLSIIHIIRNPTYRSLTIYFLYPGLTVAFYAGFLYKIIINSTPQQDNQTTEDYNKYLSFKSGLIFIALGFSHLFTGIIMNLFSQRFCKFKLANFAIFIVQLSAVTSLIAYWIKSYQLCFLCAFLWGSAENLLLTNSNAIIAKVFPGQIEGYSVFTIISVIGTCVTLIISIIMSFFPQIYFIVILMIGLVILRKFINLQQYKQLNPEIGRKPIQQNSPNISTQL